MNREPDKKNKALIERHFEIFYYFHFNQEKKAPSPPKDGTPPRRGIVEFIPPLRETHLMVFTE